MLKNIFNKYKFEIIIFFLFIFLVKFDNIMVQLMTWLYINHHAAMIYIFWYHWLMFRLYDIREYMYINYFIDIIDFLYYFGFLYFNTYILYLNKSTIYGLKFLIALLFLIFIRAGIPRYRYDFLTILGWNRFLLLSFFIFIATLVLFFFN